MKLLQINVTANWGSTGKIAEEIGEIAISKGWDSWIAYGRGNPNSRSNLIKIGNQIDFGYHLIQSRLFDRQGLFSKSATRALISKIKDINPDIIHLHNIHGYYINYLLLFDFLKEWGGNVIWTIHDCWAFTGHCAYYDYAKCEKWTKLCYDCPELKSYPKSLWKDNSKQNYIMKKKTFLHLPKLTLVPVSYWLENEMSKSFLRDYSIHTIHNGIDTQIFHPQNKDILSNKSIIILGVASVWDRRKGLMDFLKLRSILPKEFQIVLVGLSDNQISCLPPGVKGVKRTDSLNELVKLYDMADIFINPTYEDNFPTTNIEALSCGTPVITYNTGGSTEAIDNDTGIIVEKGDVLGLARAIDIILNTQDKYTSSLCRQRAVKNFDKCNQFSKYLNLYMSL